MSDEQNIRARRLPVDDDEHYRRAVLPAAFLHAGFDQDDELAREAGDEVHGTIREMLRVADELELMERALRTVEPTSQRATQARTAIRWALATVDDVLGHIDDAADAFLFRRETRKPA